MVVVIMGRLSFLSKLSPKLKLSSITASLGELGASLGSALSKIKLPTIGKISIGGGIFGGLVLGIQNGVSSAFNAASSTVRDAFGAVGITVSEGQSNMIIVAVVVVAVVGVVLLYVRRRR